MARNTQLGTCPRCFHTHSCNATGNLAQHGWSEVGDRQAGRYGNVWHTGGCRGGVAFELSAVGTWQALADAQQALEQLLAADLSAMSSNERHRHQGTIKGVRLYIADASARALAWEPRELGDRRAVEAEQARVNREEQALKADERQAKKDAKAAKAKALAANKAEAMIKLEALVREAAIGTVWSFSQLKRLTGASKGTVEDFITGSTCDYGCRLLTWSRDTSKTTSHFGKARYAMLKNKVERIVDEPGRTYDHFAVI